MSVSNDNKSRKLHDSSVPTVSVIMNCYNGEQYLKEALDTIYAQTYQDWEIIFWDNASTDSSAEIARSYGDKLKYFRGEKTVPLFAARNCALKEARGEFIAILDCDDLWLPTKLEEQVPLLEKDEKVGLVYSDAFLFNQKGKEKRQFEITKPHRGNVFPELLCSNFLNSQTVVIRKKVFDSLESWFDGRLTYVGDFDIYLRISYKWKVDYVDRPLAKYRLHLGSATFKEGREGLAMELGLMIESLSKAIDDLEYRYPEGYRRLERRRDNVLSLLDWENGDKKRARKRIKAYIRDARVYPILYFLMYFPYRYVYYPCYRIYTKSIIA